MNIPQCLLMAIVSVLAINESAIPANRDYLGVGGQSCGTWTNVRKQNDTSRHGSWILGYLSALNLWGVIGQEDALKDVDGDALYRWLDNYCQSNPLETIATGAGELAREQDRRSRWR